VSQIPFVELMPPQGLHQVADLEVELGDDDTLRCIGTA
jgi:hypothetical protein